MGTEFQFAKMQKVLEMNGVIVAEKCECHLNFTIVKKWEYYHLTYWVILKIKVDIICEISRMMPVTL